jgi:hypothetical protein
MRRGLRWVPLLCLCFVPGAVADDASGKLDTDGAIYTALEHLKKAGFMSLSSWDPVKPGGLTRSNAAALVSNMAEDLASRVRDVTRRLLIQRDVTRKTFGLAGAAAEGRWDRATVRRAIAWWRPLLLELDGELRKVGTDPNQLEDRAKEWDTLLAPRLYDEEPAEGLGPGSVQPLRLRLQEVLKKHGIRIGTVVHGGELRINYKARSFLVYGSYKDGSWSDDLHPEMGPVAGGVVLRAHYIQGPWQGAAMLPMTTDRPYFTTYTAAPYSKKQDRSLYYQLSYHKHVHNQKLLADLRAVLSAAVRE